MLTKSDFLQYLNSPLHLWAKKHDKITRSPSAFDVHIMNQGYKVEKLSKEFLETYLIRASENESIVWQKSFSDQHYTLRSDALVYKPKSDSYDLYEIKSGTSVKRENYYDVAYQYLIISKKHKIDRLFILHLNKNYIRENELDIEQLFIAVDITEKVLEISNEVKIARSKAWKTAHSKSSKGIEHCYKPDYCPCPDLCHPHLPDFSIYDIPRITEGKKKELLAMGVLDAKNIPNTFPLNLKQRLIAGLAKSKQEYIDHQAIQKEMENFNFPLYFLDYETFISAIPLYDGYHAQQQMVFQYSLHKMGSNGDKCEHTEYLSTENEEPSRALIKKLSVEIGTTGTVFVWFKPFEMTRNKELALLHADYADFFIGLNERIYDLGDFVNFGYYLHPNFKGSWSIKNVLPVMVPELSYEDMEIGKGDQAMMAWRDMINGDMTDGEKKKTKEALLKYCELDTLGMVRIFQKLWEIYQGHPKFT